MTVPESKLRRGYSDGADMVPGKTEKGGLKEQKQTTNEADQAVGDCENSIRSKKQKGRGVKVEYGDRWTTACRDSQECSVLRGVQASGKRESHRAVQRACAASKGWIEERP